LSLRTVLLFLPVSAFILNAGPVRADPAAQARFHDEQARRHYDNKDYEAAAREFFLEQRLAPNPRTLFNLALCFQQLARHGEAFAFFSEYLEAGEEHPERRSYAERALQALETKTARVRVTSSPAAAKIFVDRHELGMYGETPRVIVVGPGTHRVWVELDGYRPAGTEVRASLGQLVETQLAPQQIVGRLQVAVPTGAGVTVHDAKRAVIAKGRVPFEASLPPGSYQVAVRAPGFVPWNGLTNVEADGQTALSPTLERLPESTGDMTVTSNLAGASIEIDGRPLGFTPAVLPNLSAAPHRVMVRSPGLVDWSGLVDVRADERAWVTVTLERPPENARSPLAWVFGGVGVASLAASAVVGAFAASAHSDFARSGLTEDRKRGIDLNRAGDALLVGGLVATGAAATIYFTTSKTLGQPSRAGIARGKR
jgi:outer membrane receptor for ferrienterochelin and colicins